MLIVLNFVKDQVFTLLGKLGLAIGANRQDMSNFVLAYDLYVSGSRVV